MRRAASLLILLGLLVAAPPVWAGSVTASQHEEYTYKVGTYPVTDLRYVAGPGETNDVSVGIVEGDLQLRDPAGATAGVGCRNVDAQTVRCAGTGGTATADLGDGDDRLQSIVPFGTVTAGAGNDRVEVQWGDVVGGPGDDLIRASGLVDGGEGADDIQAGKATYAGRTEGISVDLDGEADDGAPGEGDRIVARDLVGGSGDDVLTGDANDNDIDAGPGADRIDGGAGGDRLVGGSGVDRLEGGSGRDVLAAGATDPSLPAGFSGAGGFGDPADPSGSAGVLLGGPDRDTLVGTKGPETLDGGPAEDFVEGNGGDDQLLAADGALDRVTCSAANPADGRASLDRLDLARGCATVARAGVGAPRVLVLGQSDLDDEALFRVGIACSQDQPGGCPVELTTRADGRALVRRRSLLAPGTAKLIRPRIPARYLRRALTCKGLALRLTIRTRTTDGRPRLIHERLQAASRGLRCGNSFLLGVGPEAGW